MHAKNEELITTNKAKKALTIEKRIKKEQLYD